MVASLVPVAVSPVVAGNPVQDVNTPADGVPSAGVTNVGLVANTKLPEPVSSEHSVAICADDEDVIPVIGRPVHDVKVPDDGVPNTGVTKVGDVNVPVAFVNTKAEGVPNAGVTSVGEVPNTNNPEPVSSEIFPASSADVVAAKSLNLFVVNAVAEL